MYFAPDMLEWESLEMHYSEFIAWIAQGNIDNTYRYTVSYLKKQFDK